MNSTYRTLAYRQLYLCNWYKVYPWIPGPKEPFTITYE
jgi:hypothetical protein